MRTKLSYGFPHVSRSELDRYKAAQNVRVKRCGCGSTEALIELKQGIKCRGCRVSALRFSLTNSSQSASGVL